MKNRNVIIGWMAKQLPLELQINNKWYPLNAPTYNFWYTYLLDNLESLPADKRFIRLKTP
jgi:hypothetical protein